MVSTEEELWGGVACIWGVGSVSCFGWVPRLRHHLFLWELRTVVVGICSPFGSCGGDVRRRVLGIGFFPTPKEFRCSIRRSGSIQGVDSIRFRFGRQGGVHCLAGMTVEAL